MRLEKRYRWATIDYERRSVHPIQTIFWYEPPQIELDKSYVPNYTLQDGEWDSIEEAEAAYLDCVEKAKAVRAYYPSIHGRLALITTYKVIDE